MTTPTASWWRAGVGWRSHHPGTGADTHLRCPHANTATINRLLADGDTPPTLPCGCGQDLTCAATYPIGGLLLHDYRHQPTS